MKILIVPPCKNYRLFTENLCNYLGTFKIDLIIANNKIIDLIKKDEVIFSNSYIAFRTRLAEQENCQNRQISIEYDSPSYIALDNRNLKTFLSKTCKLINEIKKQHIIVFCEESVNNKIISFFSKTGCLLSINCLAKVNLLDKLKHLL